MCVYCRVSVYSQSTESYENPKNTERQTHKQHDRVNISPFASSASSLCTHRYLDRDAHGSQRDASCFLGANALSEQRFMGAIRNHYVEVPTITFEW